MQTELPAIQLTDVPVILRANRNPLACWFGRCLLKLGRWRIVGEIPNEPRMVLAFAPHTSNWDFVCGMSVILALDVRIAWLGKHSIFKPGFRRILAWLGGLPVDRDNPQNVVAEIVEKAERDRGLALVLSPEGTRKKVERWKSGFLRVAEQTNSIVLSAALDYPGRRVVLANPFRPCGDHENEIAAMKIYFSQFQGKRPEQF